MRAFLEIASTGSFQQAAERLHITQSAVSKRIANLAHQVGQALIAPHGRRVELSPAALRLLER